MYTLIVQKSETIAIAKNKQMARTFPIICNRLCNVLSLAHYYSYQISGVQYTAAYSILGIDIEGLHTVECYNQSWAKYDAPDTAKV